MAQVDVGNTFVWTKLDDCTPVASEPSAGIERLEDLAPRLMEAMLKIASEKVDTDYDTVYKPLFEMGLVDYDEDELIDILTERGTALVADYQRLQGEAEKPFQVMLTSDLNEMNAAGVAMRQEIARLQTENAALRNVVDGLLQPSVYGIDTLTTLTYELGRYGADTNSQQDAMVVAVEMAIKRLRAK
jgi:hypothetical protein